MTEPTGQQTTQELTDEQAQEVIENLPTATDYDFEDEDEDLDDFDDDEDLEDDDK